MSKDANPGAAIAAKIGRTAAAVKLLIEAGLRWEIAKRELGLPLSEIDCCTIEDLVDLAADPQAQEALATRFALWAGAGHYHALLGREDGALVEAGLSALMRPISEGAR